MGHGKHDGNLVEAKNEVMRAKMPYSETEQKLAALIISRINPTQKNFDVYRFNIAEVLNTLKLGQKNYAYFYQIADGLLSNPIKIKLSDGRIYQSNIITDATYSEDRSTVDITMSDKMQKYLLQMDKGGFTKFYLSNILGLNSKYSIAMYRFLKSFEAQKVITKPIEELRFCLGLDHEYINFAQFKNRVLDIAQVELEEKTDIRFNYQLETRRKKVIKITFSISANEVGKITVLQMQKNLYEKAAEEKSAEILKIKKTAEKKQVKRDPEIAKQVADSLASARNKTQKNTELF